jgi:hypothetical protein
MASKDFGIRIRVEKELREAFQGACLAENRQASVVLREFMRAFAEQHSGGRQRSLFTAAPTEKGHKPRVGSKRRSGEAGER